MTYLTAFAFILGALIALGGLIVVFWFIDKQADKATSETIAEIDRIIRELNEKLDGEK